MRRVREALSLIRDDAEAAELEENIKLPSEARTRVRSFAAVKGKVDADQKRFGEVARETVRFLTGTLDLSVRDAGKLLGISYQRVQRDAR
jgi:hypothetical protein